MTGRLIKSRNIDTGIMSCEDWSNMSGNYQKLGTRPGIDPSLEPSVGAWHGRANVTP